MQDLAEAPSDHLLKETTQIEFFLQIQVLDPANLSDAFASLAGCHLLVQEGIPEHTYTHQKAT